ncbi:MAG: hypothetical protein QG593_188 [Patescibacteria group bacterium]|jgi:hypothetical protein|nr:hypothetical protein [Patescibacteria group bacterium]
MQWKSRVQKAPSHNVVKLVSAIIILCTVLVFGIVYFWSSRSADQGIVMKMMEMGVGSDYSEINGEIKTKATAGSAGESNIKFATKMDKGSFIKDVNYHNVFQANISYQKSNKQINYEIIKDNNVEYIKVSDLRQVLSALADSSELDNSKEGLQLLKDLITKYDNKWLEVDTDNNWLNEININAYKICSGINDPLKLDDDLKKKIKTAYEENTFFVKEDSASVGWSQTRSSFRVDSSKLQNFVSALTQDARLNNLKCSVSNIPKDTRLDIVKNKFTNTVSEVIIHASQTSGASVISLIFNNTTKGVKINKPQNYTKLSIAQQELEGILGVSITDIQ